MALSLSFPISYQNDKPTPLLGSSFLPSAPWLFGNSRVCVRNAKGTRNLSLSVSCSSLKVVRNPSLDKHVVKTNRIRFVQKLRTLLLSKPSHYVHLHVLSKCRSYLSLEKPRSILSMIHRYPLIFELFTIPYPPKPLNAIKSYNQLCVRLTPAAEAIATEEAKLKSAISNNLAMKLQKLLMLSSHHRLVLSKLVHLAPDLGLPPNFRSRLCNDHPDKFKTVDTSYGRALELVSWDPELAKPLPVPEVNPRGFIVDRPPKFKQLRLLKGHNVKRIHRDFLIEFQELPGVCPYNTPIKELAKESIEAEKRACSVVREVLGMTVEKRTLIDHLTHFRKELGLPNKLRGMIVRHPDMFYVSLKGHRDSVFLVEAFDDKGALIEKDETMVIKDQIIRLVQEGKRMRREKRKGYSTRNKLNYQDEDGNDMIEDGYDDPYEDGFEGLFESHDSDFEVESDDESDEISSSGQTGEFWTADASNILNGVNNTQKEPWLSINETSVAPDFPIHEVDCDSPAREDNDSRADFQNAEAFLNQISNSPIISRIKSTELVLGQDSDINIVSDIAVADAFVIADGLETIQASKECMDPTLTNASQFPPLSAARERTPKRSNVTCRPQQLKSPATSAGLADSSTYTIQTRSKTRSLDRKRAKGVSNSYYHVLNPAAKRDAWNVIRDLQFQKLKKDGKLIVPCAEIETINACTC